MEKQSLEQQLAEVLAELREVRKAVGGAGLKRLFSYEEAATAWAVSPSKVKQLVRQGRVRVTAIDGRKLIHVSEIDRIAEPVASRAPPKTKGRPKNKSLSLAEEIAAAKAYAKKR